MSTEEIAKKVSELTRKQAWYEALDEVYALRVPNYFRRIWQIVSVSVIKASPANFKPSIDRIAASSLPAPQASVTITGMYPRSAP